MSKTFIIIFILTNCAFSQKLFERNQIDTSNINTSKNIKLFGANLMYSNYTPGVEEDAIRGNTFGLDMEYRSINPFSNEFKFKVAWLIINQKGLKYCRNEEMNEKNIYQLVFYFKTTYASYYKHFMYKIGITLNSTDEYTEDCHNEIYFYPYLFTIDVGIGDINNFYFNCGLNTDIEINKSFNNNYGYFAFGFNYISNATDFIRINYYFSRVNAYYSGWILKLHQSISEKYGIITKYYYSIDLKGYSLNLGLSYAL